MATSTSYTSTVTTPVYASWKCEKCGEVSIAKGSIKCSGSVSTSSIRPSKHEEAKIAAEEYVREIWLENAYKIITNPEDNIIAMHNDLFLDGVRCRKCGKKPRWYESRKYYIFLVPAILVAIISGLIAVFGMTIIEAWVIFALSAAFVAWVYTRESSYIVTMKQKLPKEFYPVLGSLNEELLAYAAEHNTKIPTPDEAVLEASRRERIQSSTM